MKRNPILLVFQFEPSCAQAENQAPPADYIHRGRHFRQDRRMTISVACYHQTQADPLRRHRQRRQGGPAFETWPSSVRKDRKEVIEPPGGVVTEGIDLLPKRKQF